MEYSERELKFRALVDERTGLEITFDVRETSDVVGDIFEGILPTTAILEKLQGLEEYLHFTY